MIRSLWLGIAIGAALSGSAYGQQTVGSCQVLPSNNIWNTPVDTLPVLANSATMVSTIGANTGFHPDFGSFAGYGIPFVTVTAAQTKYPATFLYADESDAGPYAVPLDAPIEGGSNSTGDRHAIALDRDNCVLYELYRAFPQSASWGADSGAIFDLKSNALRPAGWTSADAAGLPIMPGLVTYAEVQSGEIRHAIRFTAPQTRREYVWPARHYASSLTGQQYPRMGERFRLKGGFDVTPFPTDVQVILRAMKKYGIILADNGSAWYLSGMSDSRWNDTNLHTLGLVIGSNLEAVDATVLMLDPNSGAAVQSGVTVSVTPSSASVRVGHTQAFAAAVTGAANTVSWSVNGVNGGNTTVGMIDPSGNYTAPSAVPGGGVVTIRATSTAVSTSSGTASATIVPHASISSVSPSSIPAGAFTITVTGSGFLPGLVISFDGAPIATSYQSATTLSGTGNAPSAMSSVPVSVTGPDGDASNVVSVSVTAAAPVGITISPASATVRVRQTRQFTAAVVNSANTSVIWKVNGIAGGNGTVGTISTSGIYRAPNSVPNPPIVTVTATSVADPTKAAGAAVTVSKH